MLQHFGFSFDATFRRAVAVFLRDLSGLTPEHQQVWAAFLVEGDFKLHPDFYRAALLGDWGQKTSLCEAFLEEIRVINAMCEAIGWLPLFRQTLDVPPSDLAFLFLPTARAFNTFVHTLDKLMSENINQDFFPSKIPREIKVSRADGSVEVQHRGTIQLLEDWLQQSFRTQDTSPLDDCLGTFRRVRKLRQKPAHALVEDTYDEALFKEQRDLFEAAYTAVRTLRLMFQNHPAARKAADEMNEQVRNGEIWTI